MDKQKSLKSKLLDLQEEHNTLQLDHHIALKDIERLLISVEDYKFKYLKEKNLTAFYSMRLDNPS